MDPLTHTLTGALLADTGLARRVPRAMPTLIVAANLPDIDALTYFIGADVALSLRRGWTHGILAIVVLPIFLAATVGLVDRWWRRVHRSDEAVPPPRFAQLLPLAYLGVASHPLLDWLNTYGIRLLMPFDDRWFYGDTLFIIDPWLWLLLGGVVFLGHSSSRKSQLAWAALAVVTSAIVFAGSVERPGARTVWFLGLLILIGLRFARRSEIPESGLGIPATHRRLAVIVLLAAVFYVSLLHLATVAARRDVEAQMAAAGGAVESVMVGPLPLRPLLHAVVIDTGVRYRVGSYDWLSEPRLLLDRRPLDKPPRTLAVAAAFRAPCLHGMANWVRFPWVEIENTDDGGHIVHLMDARYTRTRTSGFGGSSVRLNPDLTDACDHGTE